MHVQAGAGIVYDSEPAYEHRECVNKAKALFRAAEEAVRFATRGRRGSEGDEAVPWVRPLAPDIHDDRDISGKIRQCG